MEEENTAVPSIEALPVAQTSQGVEEGGKIEKEETPSVSTQIFRPIDFEGIAVTSDTNGTSESGSESAFDSAYSSDNTQILPTAGSTSNGDINPLSRKITATLQNSNLWRSFKKIGNEMIVTKPGRRLFPALLVSLQGLNPEKDYTISLRVASADDQRYRYINMKWCATGESEVIQNEERQIFRHPSSPNSGHFWMKRPISFKSIKVTHYAKSKNGNILLHTMHKYMMEIIIDHEDNSLQTIIPLSNTTFTAVSAYQNIELTQLKIDNNPFAKGFRYKIRGPGMHSTANPAISTSRSSNGSTDTLSLQPHFTGENSVMGYWQHLQMHGLVPQYNPILSLPTPPPSTSLQSATSTANSKEHSPSDTPSSSETTRSISSTLASPSFHSPILPLSSSSSPSIHPITPHFPMFYPHPFIPPPFHTSNKVNGAEKS